MKKVVLLVSLLMLAFACIAQNYTATIAIGEVDISKLEPGDDVIVPVKFIEKSGGKITTFQLFIGFDHSILQWKGTWEEPQPGIINVHKNMPYNNTSWLFNDNGNQMVALWEDLNLVGIDIENGSIFFEIVFTYKGGVSAGMTSDFIWGDFYEEVNGNYVNGKTEIWDENVNSFNLTMINGILKK